MKDLMTNVSEILRKELNVELTDTGLPASEREFSYDAAALITIWIWGPDTSILEPYKIVTELDYCQSNNFPVLVLDKMRKWIKAQLWNKVYSDLTKDEIIFDLVQHTTLLYSDPDGQIIANIETPFGDRELPYTPENKPYTYFDMEQEAYLWKLKAANEFFDKEGKF